MNVNDRDMDVMARTVYGEARGEGYEGMLAVAYVILRRLALRWRGKRTATEVCVDSKQFSCWNDGDPNRAVMLRADDSDPYFEMAVEAVQAAVHGTEPDPTGAADHYHVRGLSPFWRDDSKVTAIVGDHVFYRLTA